MHPEEFDSLFTDLQGTMFQNVVVARIKKIKGEKLTEQDKSLLKSYPMKVNEEDKIKMEKNAEQFKNDQKMAMKYFEIDRRKKESEQWR